MADPYDKPGNENKLGTDTLASDADLRSITGISKNDEAAMEKAALADQEASGDTLGKGYQPGGEQDTSASKLKDSEDAVGKTPFTYTGKLGATKIAKKFMSKKKAAAIGSLVGISSFGIVGLLSVASGPAALINAASLLNVAGQSNSDAGDDMTMRAIYYALAGQAHKGRIGLVMTGPANKVQARILLNSGAEPLYTKGGTNRLIGLKITDMEKAKASGLLDQLDPDGTRLKQGFADAVDSNGRPTNGDMILDYKNASYGERRQLIRKTAEVSGYRGFSGFAAKRLMIKRAGIKLKVFNGVRKQADQSTAAYKNIVEEETKRNITGDTDAPDGELAKEAREAAASGDEEKIKASKAKFGLGVKLGGGAIAAVGIACVARQVSQGYNDYIYDNFIQPQIRLKAAYAAAGSQVQAGGDKISLDEPGVFVANMTNNNAPLGQREFTDADPIKYLEGRGTGVKATEEQRANSEKPTVLKTVDSAYETVQIEGVNPLDGGCSIINAAGQLPGMEQINELTSAAIDGALGIVGLSQQALIDGFYGMLSGPANLTNLVGGELGAAAMQGSFFDANDQAAGMGGDYMTRAEAAQMQADSLDTIAYEKSQQSLYDRYINPYSAGSLASKVVNNAPTSTSRIASLFQKPSESIGTPLQSIASIFSGKALAAPALAYDYGSDYRGFTRAQLTDPAFENPNTNELAIQDNLAALNEKFGKCFGTTLDPSTSAYINNNGVNDLKNKDLPECNGQDNGAMITTSGVDDTGKTVQYTRSEKERYGQYILYSFASHTTMCKEGDEPACNAVGLGGAPQATTPEPANPTSPNPGTLPAGSARELAGKLADSPNIIWLNNATKEQLKAFAAGGAVTNACNEPMAISPYLSGALLALTTRADKPYKITIDNFGFAQDRDYIGCEREQKQHPKGNAVDIQYIEIIGGKKTSPGLDYVGDDGEVVSQFATDFLNLIPRNRGGVGQKGCNGMNPTFPPGSTTLNGAHFFKDGCNHLHIDVRNRDNLSDKENP